MIRAQGNIASLPDVSKPSARRMTASTVRTATSSSDFTESLSDDFDSPVKEEDTGLAMNLIKKEMVQSLTRVAAARMRQQSGAEGTNMKDAEEAIRKLATMVIDGDDETNSSDKGGSMKPDKDLRDLLRQALVVGDGESAGADFTETSVKDGDLDIWHPDYWVAGDESLNGRSELSNSMHTDSMHTGISTGISTCPSRSSGVHTESDESGERTESSSSLASESEEISLRFARNS